MCLTAVPSIPVTQHSIDYGFTKRGLASKSRVVCLPVAQNVYDAYTALDVECSMECNGPDVVIIIRCKRTNKEWTGMCNNDPGKPSSLLLRLLAKCYIATIIGRLTDRNKPR